MGKSTTGEIYYDRQKSMFMDYKEIPFHVSFLENYLFSKNFLAGISDPIKFAQEICEVYLFINDIHAFREGNGRTQNEFIRQLEEKNGFILDIQERMESLKEQGINYYKWFHIYNLTGDKSEILDKLFISNIYPINNKKTKRTQTKRKK